MKNNDKKNCPHRRSFKLVHKNVGELLHIYQVFATKVSPDHEAQIAVMYKLATHEYLTRTGWNVDDFADMCDQSDREGHLIEDDGEQHIVS